MSEDRAPLLVLGLGDRLLTDDGFGLVLLAKLRRIHGEDPGIEFMDGGTLGAALLGELEGRRGILILDTVAGGQPGEVMRVNDPLARSSSQGVGAYGTSASLLLGAASLVDWLPERVVVIGATPLVSKTGVGLSIPLRMALPPTLELAQETLAELRAAVESDRPVASTAASSSSTRYVR